MRKITDLVPCNRLVIKSVWATPREALGSRHPELENKVEGLVVRRVSGKMKAERLDVCVKKEE